MVEIEQIDKDCEGCSDTATIKIKMEKRELTFCNSCVKELYWQLSHDVYLPGED